MIIFEDEKEWKLWNFEDEKEWYYAEDSEIKEVDKYGSLGSSVTCRL